MSKLHQYAGRTRKNKPAPKTPPTPFSIIRELGIEDRHVLIHPAKHGYGYTVFWGEKGALEIIASSPRSYRTKQECVRAIKKLSDFWFTSSLIVNYVKAYDHKGKRIDIEIKYDVKRLL